MKTNVELNELIKNEDIVRFIKSQRIRLFGYVHRMEPVRNTRKVTECRPFETRRRGRPRWLADVVEDLRILGVRNLRRVADDRGKWISIRVVAPEEEEEDVD